MCRLIVTNRNDFELYDNEYGILRLLEYLEQTRGRDGNGYALVSKGRISETLRGRYVTNKQIYDLVSHSKAKEWDFFIWHTRISSMHLNSDEHFHPHVHDNDCLVHNGLEPEVRPISRAFVRTGTEVLFRNIIGTEIHRVTKALSAFPNSTFAGSIDGRPFAVNGGGELHRWDAGDRTFHSSVFMDNDSSFTATDSGYIWMA